MTTDNQPLDREPQEQDDFDAAFDEFASKDQEPVDDLPADEPEHDERDAPPEDDLAARLAALEAENQRLKHSEASQRGRLGAYQRQINELQRQTQERQGAPQPPQHAGQAPEGDDQQRQDMAQSMGLEDWESFAEDFPDMAKAFEARLSADRQERARLERELADVRAAVEPIQQQAQEQHLRAQEDALTARHPDWREVVAAPEFAEWLNQQPDSLQRLTASDDAAEAAALLDMYRVHTGSGLESRAATHDKRRDRLAAAQTVSRRGAAPRSGAPDDFDAAFDHYAAKKARHR